MSRYSVARRSAACLVAALAAVAVLTPGVADATAAPPVTLVSETFPTTAIPAGWKFVNQSDSQPGWFLTDPGHHGNHTGGTGDFASIDSALMHAGGGVGFVHASVLSPYLNKAARSIVTVTFNTDLVATQGSDVSSLQWSLDKGKTWTSIWSVANTSIAPGTKINVQLPAAVTAAKHFSVRWTNRSSNAGYWEIDNLVVTASF